MYDQKDKDNNEDSDDKDDGDNSSDLLDNLLTEPSDDIDACKSPESDD